MQQKMQQKVYRFPNETRTVTMFPYGNAWRVRYVITDNDSDYSRLMEYVDEKFENKSKANVAYCMLCAILSISDGKVNKIEIKER